MPYIKKVIARLWTSFQEYCRLFYSLCQIDNRILEKCDYLAPKFSENATLFQCYSARGLLMLKVNSVCQKAKFYSLLCYSTVEIKRVDKKVPNCKNFIWYIYLRYDTCYNLKLTKRKLAMKEERCVIVRF